MNKQWVVNMVMWPLLAVGGMIAVCIFPLYCAHYLAKGVASVLGRNYSHMIYGNKN